MTTPPTTNLPPPPQSAPFSTTLQLKRDNQSNQAGMMYGYHSAPPQPPATPSAWFTQRFPAEVKRWGCPFLEAVMTNPVMMTTTTQAVALNDHFFAAILSDQQLGHAVVHFEPERQWCFREPRNGLFHPTTEAKLLTVLSALLLRCAEELRSRVDLASLFVTFRAEEQLKAIVKKARSLLAADASFFSATSPHQRVAGDELPVRSARQFIQASIKPTPGHLLTVQECFTAFLAFCESRGLEAGEQRAFRQLIIDIIRDEFGLGFRTDLKRADGRYMRGWKGLTVEVAGRG